MLEGEDGSRKNKRRKGKLSALSSGEPSIYKRAVVRNKLFRDRFKRGKVKGPRQVWSRSECYARVSTRRRRLCPVRTYSKLATGSKGGSASDANDTNPYNALGVNLSRLYAIYNYI